MEGQKERLHVLSLQFYCYPDEVGGAWKYTYEVNRRLAAKGHRISLITCKPDAGLADHEVIDGVHYHRIGVEASKSVPALWRGLGLRIRAIQAAAPVDLLHIHNPLVAILALARPDLWAVPKIYHFHSLWHDEELINRRAAAPPEQRAAWPFRLKTWLLAGVIRAIEWACFAAADAILFLSEYSKRRFGEFYPLAKRELRVIPGGVDTAAFAPQPGGRSREECRRQLGLPAAAPVFLTVRRLAARMGLENLIDACALLARQRPDLPFVAVIVGKGGLLESLRRQIAAHHLEDRILLPGVVTGAALPLYYNAADLFVLPTTAIEGFGLATVEALACGLPVFGTPVGGTVEILRGIDPRLLFADASAAAIAARLLEFLENPAPVRALSGHCRETVARLYAWERVVSQLEEVFYRAAGAAPAR